MTQNNIRKILENHPIIPVVTFNEIDEVSPMIEKLLEKNIRCIEITLRTPIAYAAIQKVKNEFSEKMQVGMGTVVNLSQIQKAIDLEIDFIVSPGINASLFESLENSKIAFIPGVATPSEIILAMQQGYDTLKFFPAHLFGADEALKTYGQVFPSIKFCPTGGITEETFTKYLSLENVICVGGSWMTK